MFFGPVPELEARTLRTVLGASVLFSVSIRVASPTRDTFLDVHDHDDLQATDSPARSPGPRDQETRRQTYYPGVQQSKKARDSSYICTFWRSHFCLFLTQNRDL